MTDQFTRWCCPKCGKDGIDSWNKAMFDGVDHAVELPNPWILGDTCQRCHWPVVVRYTTPDTPPRAIVGPLWRGLLAFNYEGPAFAQLQADPDAGLQLKPADSRDADWSRGCIAATGQLQ